MTNKINIFWHRRDLRLEDNCGLFHALSSERPVLPIFIFDRNILDKLEDKEDARVSFIHREVNRLNDELIGQGSSLLVQYGNPQQIWQELIETYQIEVVYTNRDYEPYALDRDSEVQSLLASNGIAFHTFKDHVIYEKGDILKSDGNPYTVFTPFSKKWRARLNSNQSSNGSYTDLMSFDTETLYDHFYKMPPHEVPSLEFMGFQPSNLNFPSRTVKQGIIRHYDQTRNFPSIEGTSRLGVHFRFGTISIREKARKALALNDTYLNELIWRDFYSMILAHFPHVVERSFRSKYDFIQWNNNEVDFEKWCKGQTGYPIVDAGMRELNSTGYMHNRVRMITASFLTKHLLIDWRWGEAYFARKLLDFDLASNNGGWQWASGSGTDAAPYFRIFNPTSQQQKFDKEYKYIKRWVPEYGTAEYVKPMVDHKWARERCLEVYKEGLGRAAASLGT